VAVKTGDPSVCDEIGTASVSYLGTGQISRETCYEKAGGKGTVSLARMYEQNPANFEFCEDLAYAQIYGRAPPATQGSHKSDVGARLTNTNEYYVVSQGYVAPGTTPNVDLKNGDILVLGFDAAPDPGNANHYAVVQGSNVSQILSWKDPATNRQAGYLDSQKLSWYFTTREVTNPYTQERKTSPQVYKYYIQYRKK
jgi:hypothetical protein